MKKLRVLQVNKLYYPWIGGVEKVVQQIAEGLCDKVEMEVLACSPRGKGSSSIVNGVRITLAGSLGMLFSMPLSFSFPFLFRRISRGRDILHFHMPFPLADICCLLFGPRTKVIAWWHSDIVKQKHLMMFYGPVMELFLKRADRIIVATEDHITSSKYLPKFRDKCVIIPFGIDTAKYAAPVLSRIEVIRGSYRKPLVLFVGRLVYYKGIEYLVEAMKDTDAVLLIAGEGILKQKLENMAEQSGIRDKIVFLGRVDDEALIDYYHACDLLAFPSVENSEAFGLVQIEAMACSKPVVSTSLPTGAGRVNIHGETGLQVPVKDAAALSSAMTMILASKELMTKMGRKSRERAEKEFSLDRMLSKVLELYKSV